jgi:hypothetical protein
MTLVLPVAITTIEKGIFQQQRSRQSCASNEGYPNVLFQSTRSSIIVQLSFQVLCKEVSIKVARSLVVQEV